MDVDYCIVEYVSGLLCFLNDACVFINFNSSITGLQIKSVSLYPLFSLEKKGILILCQSRSVVRLSVCPSVTFLVNVSPPKPLEVATSNFVVE